MTAGYVVSAAVASALPMPLHSVAWDDDRATFTCHAEVGGMCRLVCAEDCDEETWPCGVWDYDADRRGSGYAMTDSGECQVLLFLDNADADDAYTGGTALPHRGGPIAVEWDGDWYVWQYADELRAPSCTCADPHLVDLYRVESRDAVARLCTRCGRSQA